MRRHHTNVLLAGAAAVALSGCAYQDPLALPDLGPPARSSQQYPGYNPYYGPGSTFGYGTYGYGYGSGYRQGYDPYYYDPYGYGGRYPPQYYSPGVVYVPYPVPCVDANRNGRCDKRPPKDQDGDGRNHGNQGGGRDGDRDAVPPRYQRDGQRQPGQRQPGDGPRLQTDMASGTGAAVAPSPLLAVPPQAVPASPSPVQAPPPQSSRRVAPPSRDERAPKAGQRRPARADSPTQEP